MQSISTEGGVEENIENLKYRVYNPSSSRLVHHQLLHVSFCVYSRKLVNLSIFLLSLTLSDEITEFPVFSPQLSSILNSQL